MTALNHLDPVQLAVELSQLPPELIIAARVGLEVAAARAGITYLHDDVLDGRWHRNNVLNMPTELMKRRWPPTGNRDLWVRFGPAGPPPVMVEAEAA